MTWAGARLGDVQAALPRALRQAGHFLRLSARLTRACAPYSVYQRESVPERERVKECVCPRVCVCVCVTRACAPFFLRVSVCVCVCECSCAWHVRAHHSVYLSVSQAICPSAYRVRARVCATCSFPSISVVCLFPLPRVLSGTFSASPFHTFHPAPVLTLTCHHLPPAPTNPLTHPSTPAQVPELAQEEFKFLREDAPWMDAVHAILGSDCKLHYMGW